MTVPLPKGGTLALPEDHPDFEELMLERRRWWVWHLSGQLLSGLLASQDSENVGFFPSSEAAARAAVEQAQALVKELEDKVG